MSDKNGGSMEEVFGKMMNAYMEKMNKAPAAGGWGAPAAPEAAEPPFTGVSIPIKVETPMGSARCYLSLPPEVAADPAALLDVIRKLVAMGVPVDLYQPKQEWNRGGGGGGGGWGGGNRGGYGGGNGYDRGNGGGGGGWNNGGGNGGGGGYGRRW